MEYNFNSSIRDYHVYKNVWKYEIGDKLICEREENNPNDKFSDSIDSIDDYQTHL
jgi:hypothetical protein